MSDMARINAFLAAAEVQRQDEADKRTQLRLGRLIADLGAVGQDKTCVIEGSIEGNPDRAISYRGYYSDLAIDPSGTEDVAVSTVLAFLRDAVYDEFEGYKGGHYLMRPDTLVWVAEYGDTGSHGIVEVVEEPHAVVLRSEVVEDWS